MTVREMGIVAPGVLEDAVESVRMLPALSCGRTKGLPTTQEKGLLSTRAFTGWSAYASAAATIIGFVTLIAFFAAGEPFGVINDLTTVIHALSMVPLAFVLHKLHRRTAPRLSVGAFVIGVLAMITAAALSALIVLGLVRLEPTLAAVPLAFGVIGVWLVLNSYLGRSSGTLPKGLTWVGIVAGGAFVLV